MVGVDARQFIRLFEEIDLVHGPPADGCLLADCQIADPLPFQGNLRPKTTYLLKITPMETTRTSETADVILRRSRIKNSCLRELAFLDLVNSAAANAAAKGVNLALVNVCLMRSWTRISMEKLKTELLRALGLSTKVQGGYGALEGQISVLQRGFELPDEQQSLSFYDAYDDDDDGGSYVQPPRQRSPDLLAPPPEERLIANPKPLINHKMPRLVSASNSALLGTGYGAPADASTTYQVLVQQSCEGGTLEDYLLARAHFDIYALRLELIVIYAQLFLQLHTLRVLFPNFSHGSLNRRNILLSTGDHYHVLHYQMPAYVPGVAGPVNFMVPLTSKKLCVKLVNFQTVSCLYQVTSAVTGQRVGDQLPGTEMDAELEDDCYACSRLCKGLFEFDAEKRIPQFGQLMRALRHADPADPLVFGKLLQTEQIFAALINPVSAAVAYGWAKDEEEFDEAKLRVSPVMAAGFNAEAAFPFQIINTAI